jgi:hypothetical protein
MRRSALPFLFLLLFGVFGQAAFGQTVTFTTQGGASYPEHYTIVSENGLAVSGIVQIAQDYGYSKSGIVLPNNPTAPGQYLNPVINILTATYVGAYGSTTRTVTYTFNSTENLYGFTWSGTFTATLICTRYFRNRCIVYTPTTGSGSMTASPAQ